MVTLDPALDHPLVMKRWEFGVLLVETLVAGSALMAAFMVALPRFLEGVLELPRGLWAAGGFFALFWAIVPLLNVYARARRGRELPLLGTLLASVLAAAVGGGIFAFLI